MVKTTVYLDAETAVSLREIAERRGRPQAELIREALRAYAAIDKPPLPSVGAFRSGRNDIAETYRTLLKRAVKEDKWP